MKRLQTLTLVILATAALGLGASGLAGAARADDAKPGPKLGLDFTGKRADPEARMNRLADKLNLTPLQRTQSKAILDDARRAVGAALLDDGLTWAQRRERFKEIRTQARERFETVLTSEQKEQLEQMKSSLKERIRARWRDRGVAL